MAGLYICAGSRRASIFKRLCLFLSSPPSSSLWSCLEAVYSPAHKSLGIYLPLITTNCAVLGVTILNIDTGYGFGESLVNTFGAGLGFMLAMIMFAGVRERLESADIPAGLKGLPITLVAASLVSVSFIGFQGLFGL